MKLVTASCRYIRKPNAEKVTWCSPKTSHLPPRQYLHFSFLGDTFAYNLLLAATVHCFGFIAHLYHIKGVVLTHAHPGTPLDSTQSFSSLDIRSRALLHSAFSHAWVRHRLLFCTSVFSSRISSINARLSGSTPSFLVSLSYVASAAFWWLSHIDNYFLIASLDLARDASCCAPVVCRFWVPFLKTYLTF